MILEGILNSLAKLDNETRDISVRETLDELVSSQADQSSKADKLRPVQGTVILHMVFALKHDQV